LPPLPDTDDTDDTADALHPPLFHPPPLGPDQAAGRSHQSVTELVSDHIRERIVTGELKPGAKVDQDQISQTLGISRIPVREALIQLTANGYIESIPRRGAFVAKLTVQDFEDHFEVVSALFEISARRAAEHVTDEQLQYLKKVHLEASTAQDTASRMALAIEFYRYLHRLRRTSGQFLRTLQFVARALPNDLYFSTARSLATETVYRERTLLALENHDSEAAAQAAEEHWRASAKVTIDEMRSRGYWSESEDLAGDGQLAARAAGD